MKLDLKAVAIGLLMLALAAGGRWWWQQSREQVWVAEHQSSPEAIANPFLAANRFLVLNGYQVETVAALEHLRTVRDGTLIIGGGEGLMTKEQSAMVLAWVARGNTLIFQPREATKAELAAAKVVDKAAPAPATSDEEVDNPYDDGVEHDPLGKHLGTRWHYESRDRDYTCKNAAGAVVPSVSKEKCPAGTVFAISISAIPLPGRAPALVDTAFSRVLRMPGGAAPIWTDNTGMAVQGFRHGKGQIVVAPHLLFRNPALVQNDNAALLLGLAKLNPESRHITIVKSRKVLGWMELLWTNYSKLLMALAALLALLFWAAVRRFGPILPDAAPQRRSLMEHIAASGAWLWQADGGRQTLLLAARRELEEALQRRAPGLLRLGQNSQHEELGRLCGLPPHEVAHAMHDDASSSSADFTRQIRTLQTLRKHYER